MSDKVVRKTVTFDTEIFNALMDLIAEKSKKDLTQWTFTEVVNHLLRYAIGKQKELGETF